MNTKHTLIITDQSFDEVLQKNTLLLVDFWAQWCGPCVMLAPVIDALATSYVGRVAIGKVDVDTNAQLSTRYQIKSIPTLLLFHQQKLVETLQGNQPQSSIAQILDRYLQK